MEPMRNFMRRDFREWEAREREIVRVNQERRRRGNRPGTRLYDRVTLQNMTENQDLFNRIAVRREETNARLRLLRDLEARVRFLEDELTTQRDILRDVVVSLNQLIQIHQNIDFNLQNRRIQNLVLTVEWLMNGLRPGELLNLPNHF